MRDYSAAIRALEAGRAVVMPTDTVYGLAVIPGIPGAVDGVFRIKGRPPDKPLAILGPSVRGFSGLAIFDRRAAALAERYWPGPLTMVLPRAPAFTTPLGPRDAPGVAVRVPAGDVALELLGLAGALAVTSANRSGAPPAATVDAARSDLGDEVAVYIDGGECTGTPSSVVSLLGAPKMMREGSIPFDDIQTFLSSLQ
jgi:L-threonylcarbamoyladenylate synthase